MLKDFEGALGLLDEATADVLPQAAALKLQLLHDQGLFDDAFAQGNQFLERHAGNQMILASMSTLALDVEDADLARKCAEQAGDHPEAHTTLGILALGEQEGMVKTVFDAKTGELLGAHMVGAEVTELIQGYGIAKTLESTEVELMHAIFPHPTLSEMMHEAVLAADGAALHI